MDRTHKGFVMDLDDGPKAMMKRRDPQHRHDGNDHSRIQPQGMSSRTQCSPAQLLAGRRDEADRVRECLRRIKTSFAADINIVANFWAKEKMGWTQAVPV